MTVDDKLKKALEHAGEGYTLEDVRKEIAEGRAHLWNTEKSAAVTQILDVWLYGGELEDLPELERQATERAKACGIEQIIFWGGRKGWERVLKHHGYVEKTILVKEF